MTREEMKQYQDKRAVGTYCLNNWGGIEILDIQYGIEDYVIWRWNYGSTDDVIHRSKIRYGGNHSSFRAGRLTIRLDECMRVG